MEVRNNTYNPNFTAIIVDPKGLKRFNRALRNECSNDQLIRTLQIFEREQSNPNHIILEDLGYLGGLPCDGHFRAQVNGKNYWNSSNIFFPISIPNFLNKLSKKAQGFAETDFQAGRRKVIAKNEKLEQVRLKELRQKGLVSEEEQRNTVLGFINEIINKNNKKYRIIED